MQQHTKTILVVEDDGLVLNILSDHLKRLNYNVILASDGKQAVEKAIKHKPDLVLLDLLLPEMDGYKVLEAIRKNPDPEIANTIVIVLSNLWSEKDILSAQALKIDAYFVKTTTDLNQVMDQVRLSLSRV